MNPTINVVFDAILSTTDPIIIPIGFIAKITPKCDSNTQRKGAIEQLSNLIDVKWWLSMGSV